MDDDALLRRIGDNDERAFSLLVSRHLERTRAIAYGIVLDAQDADEIAQDVFLTVWRKAGAWQKGGAGGTGRARFRTWLHRVTVNRCIDRLRRARLRRWTGLEAIAGRLASSDDPERTAGVRQRLARTRKAMAGLPERQRMALMLAVEGELTVPEVAESLGVTTGAAEQLLVRARRTLRAAEESE